MFGTLDTSHDLCVMLTLSYRLVGNYVLVADQAAVRPARAVNTDLAAKFASPVYSDILYALFFSNKDERPSINKSMSKKEAHCLLETSRT